MPERCGFHAARAAGELRATAAMLRAGPADAATSARLCARDPSAADTPLEMIMVQTPTGAAMRVPVRKRVAATLTATPTRSDGQQGNAPSVAATAAQPCEGAPLFDDALAAAPQSR
ncbi:MAG: hypothetical protein AAFZ01_02830 [Pseudomonadota bacterium]